MQLSMYQIDAFAKRSFTGNPAAVCPLVEWLPSKVMQSIAEENNLAETAFFVPARPEAADCDFEIRWFTPAAEVDLCGHATLASAYVLFNELGFAAEKLTFDSRSGPLEVRKIGDRFEMDFPTQVCTPCSPPAALVNGLGLEVQECLFNEDYLVVLGSQEQLQSLKPNYTLLKELDTRGVVVTAPSTEFDFVARFFAPGLSIDEDPVTGSAFTKLAPYWAERVGKTKFKAKQISSRGGEVDIELVGQRVKIIGTAIKYLHGSICFEL